jgi:hypothetical protein
MEIKRKYLQKYLHRIAIDQLADQYAEMGYEVSNGERLGKYEADLIARKGKETIVIEIKAGRLSAERKKAIAELSNYVREQGDYKFLVAVATHPKQKKIEIIQLAELISEYLLEEFPDELSELATHVRLDEVSDIELDSVEIKDLEIFVDGSGVVSVELQYGSDGDQARGDGVKTSDSFPFEFEVTLAYRDEKLEITEVDKLKVDNSSFYENGDYDSE